ncbi:MAG: hypothetical protein ABS35_26485 [Kaistia sp. SCN 65-12]|nr:MAG: hypothetical protein ABS35_26485 [Kaistia sp. SCN 65-12]
MRPTVHDIADKAGVSLATVDRVLNDGDTVSVGANVLTVHATPAHSPGSSSWTWQSCEGKACKTIAYADNFLLMMYITILIMPLVFLLRHTKPERGPSPTP